jgi:hypothetical protein
MSDTSLLLPILSLTAMIGRFLESRGIIEALFLGQKARDFSSRVIGGSPCHFEDGTPHDKHQMRTALGTTMRPLESPTLDILPPIQIGFHVTIHARRIASNQPSCSLCGYPLLRQSGLRYQAQSYDPQPVRDDNRHQTHRHGCCNVRICMAP